MKRSGKNTQTQPSANGRPSKRSRKSANGGAEAPCRFYGIPLPGVKPEELSGSLIVVEGTDGSGRSTQISLLTEWLECEGFAVETMGLRRSFLVGADGIGSVVRKAMNVEFDGITIPELFLTISTTSLGEAVTPAGYTPRPRA